MTTNIPKAVRLAFDSLQKSKRQNRVILLMSDGKIDLLSQEKDAAAAAELEKMLPDIAKAGIRIYTVAFSEFSDAALLRPLQKKPRVHSATRRLTAIFMLYSPQFSSD